MLTAEEVAAHLGKRVTDPLTEADGRALAAWWWSLGYRGGFDAEAALFMAIMSDLHIYAGGVTIGAVDWPAVVAKFKGDQLPDVLTPGVLDLSGAIAQPFLDAAGRALPAAAILGLIVALGFLGLRRIV